MFSPSAQFTEAANKARQLIFIIRRPFQDLAKSEFIPLYGTLVRPQPSSANSKISYKVGYWHALPPLRREIAAVGPLFLAVRRLRADLITAFKIFKGILDIDPNLFFLPPARCGLSGHPYKVLQGASHRRRRWLAFSMRALKYWNRLPASVVTAPSVKVFKKCLENVWTELFPHIPH